MRRVDRLPNVEVDICSLLKEKSADLRRAVLIEIPLLIKLIFIKIILGVLYYLVYGNNAITF